MPVTYHKRNPRFCSEIVDMAKLALDKFNQDVMMNHCFATIPGILTRLIEPPVLVLTIILPLQLQRILLLLLLMLGNQLFELLLILKIQLSELSFTMESPVVSVNPKEMLNPARFIRPTRQELNCLKKQ